MLRPLPEPIRGCTHVDMTEAFFSLAALTAYVRGSLGTLDVEGVFVPDTDLKPCYVDWRGPEFVAMAQTLNGDAIVAAAQAKNWGFSLTPPEDILETS